MTIRVTPELLIAAMGCRRDAAYQFAVHLDAACVAGGITTVATEVARLAIFLAQLGHESGALVYVRELADGSAYEGRSDLGNIQSGDGRRYRGRGLIQTTGRANYRATRGWITALGLTDVPDFESEPELLETTRWAAWSAVGFWHANRLNTVSDGDDERACVRVGRGINRGNVNDIRPAIGEDDRIRRWQRARPEVAAAAGAPAAAQQQPAPIVTATPVPVSPPQVAAQETPMPIPILVGALARPFLEAAAGAIARAVPKLGELFAGESPVAKRNVAAAAIAVDVVKQTLGARNEQELVETLASGGPDAAAAAARAVEDNWFRLHEAAEQSAGAARKYAAAMAATPQGDRFWRTLAIVTFLAMGFLTFANLAVVGMWVWAVNKSVGVEAATQMVSVVIQADIGATLSAIAFWLGSSFGSRQKDETRQAS